MNKTALITGASRGIGFAIAKALSSHVETLILVAKNKENLEKTCIQFTKIKIVPIVADLENESSVIRLIEKIKKDFKSLDILVNNAGAYVGKQFENTSLDEVNKLINLNFKAYYVLTQQLLPLLRNGKNSQIINISSCAAHANIYGESLYSATKAAVTTFSDVIRKELNEKNIRVTAIQPWGVNTYSADNSKTLLDPNEIGKLVAYIVNTSPETQFDLVELSHIRQWRGQKPSWIE